MTHYGFKRSVFISYHHANDQHYCNTFRQIFCNEFGGIFSDNSLSRARDSDDVTYLDRVIREQYIRPSDATVVLCGQDTDLRKFVDWEIHDTVNENHGLLAVILPSCGTEWIGSTHRYRLPPRLQDHLDSGYAYAIQWTNSAWEIHNAVEQCLTRNASWRRANARQLRQINGYRRF